ncbi:TonB-dependent receptor [Pedobacter nyackensis]|uniref:TonB-dependent receptor n=1 Tax=Pedobacter nyackensis TaxID=475255 RepID=UPI002930EF5F|nr:TonB-dependent receptor [Pedobacter nyackensis]
MKLTAMFLVVIIFQASASTLAQSISLTEKNSPLEKVLENVRKQSGFELFYISKDMKKASPVTVNLKDVPLNDALTAIFKNQPLYFTIELKNIIIKQRANPLPSGLVVSTANINVQGRVIDDAGLAIPGVSVKVKGTARATTTDEDGRFSLRDISENAILLISSVGYIAQEVSVGAKTELIVTLVSDVGSLNEVVVTALGNSQKKISVVGAIASITTKELKQSPVANLTNALAGRLPGLITTQTSNAPGDGANLYIRGLATLGSSTAPLFVVDGLPRSTNDFAQLDPNEIESLTILKDANSTSLYGIQGANGVVVVTTRRGKLNQKPEINVTGQYASVAPIRLPQMMDTYNSALFDNEAQQTEIWTQKDLDIIRAGTDPYTYPNMNWFDYLLKSSTPQQQYNVNFTGGSTFAKYFVSGSMTNQSALFKYEDQNAYGVKSGFNRYNFRSNIDLQVTKMLELSVDVAGRLEQRDGPGAGYGAIFSALNSILPNVTAPFNPNGSIAHGGKVFWASDKHNPLAALTQSGYYSDYTNVLNGAFTARHNLDILTKGLSAQATFTFQNDNNKFTQRTQNYDSFWYKGLDAENKPIYQQIRTKTSLATSGSSRITRSNYIDFRVNYNRSFGKHDVSAQLLANRTLSIINDDLPYAYQGLSSRITYGYGDRYFTEITLGYNGSENFPAGKRYGFFPAFGAGWVVTNESFLPKNDMLSYLKVRGSYGLSGNDKVGGNRWLFISDFAPTGGYSFGVSPAGQGGYSENRVGNPNVTWEQAKKANLGVDAYLFKDFAKITFDIFRENRSNILLNAGTVPDYIGVSGLAPRNTGEVLNRGFETELLLTKKFGGFTISSTMQLTYARNKIINNDQPTPAYPYQDLKGYEVGYQLAYKSIGIFNSQEEINNSPVQRFSTTMPGDIKYLDVNKDGVIDAADRVPVQIQNVPRYVWGASLRLAYKGFDFSFLLNGALGSTTFMGSSNPDFVLRGRSVWEQRWTPTNTENPLLPNGRRTSNNYQTSSFWIMGTNYTKLRNAEIGYELPKRWISKIKLNYLRLFVNGQNLHVWDNMWIQEQDPESSQGQTAYPASRTINAGLSIRL